MFIDADKENNSAYVQWAIELGRPGTVIVVDNIVRDGRILDPAADDHQAQAVRDMLEMMGRHPKSGHRRDPDGGCQGLGRLRVGSGEVGAESVLIARFFAFSVQ